MHNNWSQERRIDARLSRWLFLLLGFSSGTWRPPDEISNDLPCPTGYRRGWRFRKRALVRSRRRSRLHTVEVSAACQRRLSRSCPEFSASHVLYHVQHHCRFIGGRGPPRVSSRG